MVPQRVAKRQYRVKDDHDANRLFWSGFLQGNPSNVTGGEYSSTDVLIGRENAPQEKNIFICHKTVNPFPVSMPAIDPSFQNRHFHVFEEGNEMTAPAISLDVIQEKVGKESREQTGHGLATEVRDALEHPLTVKQG